MRKAMITGLAYIATFTAVCPSTALAKRVQEYDLITQGGRMGLLIDPNDIRKNGTNGRLAFLYKVFDRENPIRSKRSDIGYMMTLLEVDCSNGSIRNAAMSYIFDRNEHVLDAQDHRDQLSVPRSLTASSDLVSYLCPNLALASRWPVKHIRGYSLIQISDVLLERGSAVSLFSN